MQLWLGFGRDGRNQVRNGVVGLVDLVTDIVRFHG